MKKLFVVLVLVAFGFSMNSCKKYEDGPTLSLRSKSARLVNTWVIEKAMNAGIDVTSMYPTDYQLSIMKDNTYEIATNGLKISGTWEFTEDKEGLKLTQSTTGTEFVYTILMLKNKELTLSQTLQSETFTIYFVEKPE